jgi:hypothetical protein
MHRQLAGDGVSGMNPEFIAAVALIGDGDGNDGDDDDDVVV